MIKKKVQEEINDQIQAEFQSAYLYLALSAWFEARSLTGFAQWMKVQWQEETDHALKFYEHLVRRDGEVQLKKIEAPELNIDSATDAFEQILEQERNITKRIHKLYDLARKEGDYPLETLLHWFIDEQVEEEEQAREILDKLKLIGDDGSNLYLLDRELGERQPEQE
jgi:ferritin